VRRSETTRSLLINFRPWSDTYKTIVKYFFLVLHTINGHVKQFFWFHFRKQGFNVVENVQKHLFFRHSKVDVITIAM
jgi:hypothetical protein